MTLLLLWVCVGVCGCVAVISTCQHDSVALVGVWVWVWVWVWVCGCGCEWGWVWVCVGVCGCVGGRVGATRRLP